MAVGIFPFGRSVQRVVQEDRRPKRVFVLGVYASAVHARWIDEKGATLIRALGVASEPHIFWAGQGAKEIVAAIDVPPGAGRLVPAASSLNGPSGRSLDKHFLAPLGLTRNEAWLCDLVPHSCMNRGQAKAIERHYLPRAKELGLARATWPPPPKTLADAARREEISAELRASDAGFVVTLGDQPLRWFARVGSRSALGAFGQDPKSYGRWHDTEIDGRKLKLLPLVHPRQAAGLGGHSALWKALHAVWIQDVAPGMRMCMPTPARRQRGGASDRSSVVSRAIARASGGGSTR